MTLQNDKNQMKLRFQWELNWKIMLFTAFFLPVTISLAFWQVDRADEKRQLLDMYKYRAEAQPVPISSVQKIYFNQNTEVDHLGYVRVEVNGQYNHSSTLLLDNRVRGGRPGYEVISPFQTTAGYSILVNRGWIPADLDRRILPEIPSISGNVSLVGYLYRSPGKQIMLGEDPWVKGESRIVIQSLDPEIISNKLGNEFYDYSLRLDAGETGALMTGWFVVNVQPGKHTGYAYQWGALALALIILAIFANSNLGLFISSRSK